MQADRTALPQRQQQALDVLGGVEMRSREFTAAMRDHGVLAGQAHDLIGALLRKGLVELVWRNVPTDDGESDRREQVIRRKA